MNDFFTFHFLQFFTEFGFLDYCLWENSSADGCTDGGGQGFGPECYVFGVLGFDHDARFGFGARVTHDNSPGGAKRFGRFINRGGNDGAIVSLYISMV